MEDIDRLEAQGQQSDETNEQLEAAKKAAKGLIESGAVGPTDGSVYFTTSLSGHANPEHKPAEGFANDCVTVSVSQVRVPQPVNSEEAAA